MIYINNLYYNEETNSIVFDYTLPTAEDCDSFIVDSIDIFHNNINHELTLTTEQLELGQFSISLSDLEIDTFEGLFNITFTYQGKCDCNNFGAGTTITYTIGNLSKYEKCLVKLITNSQLIDCKFVNNNLCTTFQDSCKNNIYFLSTLLASIYRAIECGMIEEADEILEKIKQNLDCCDCCIENCDFIYIKDNKYGPYHYFDNEPDPLVTECDSEIFINDVSIGNVSCDEPNIINLIQNGEVIEGNWDAETNTWTLPNCPDCGIATYNLVYGDVFLGTGEIPCGTVPTEIILNSIFEENCPDCENIGNYNLVIGTGDDFQILDSGTLPCTEDVTNISIDEILTNYCPECQECPPACDTAVLTFPVSMENPIPNINLECGQNLEINISSISCPGLQIISADIVDGVLTLTVEGGI
jgi:hypothetical protein